MWLPSATTRPMYIRSVPANTASACNPTHPSPPPSNHPQPPTPNQTSTGPLQPEFLPTKIRTWQSFSVARSCTTAPLHTTQFCMWLPSATTTPSISTQLITFTPAPSLCTAAAAAVAAQQCKQFSHHHAVHQHTVDHLHTSTQPVHSSRSSSSSSSTTTTTSSSSSSAAGM